MRVGPYTTEAEAKLACNDNEVVTLENRGYYTMDIDMAIMFHHHEIIVYPAIEAKDEKAGYNDRINGYYDKWYRYNRIDNGAAYDRGCIKAVNSGLCNDNFTLIECM